MSHKPAPYTPAAKAAAAKRAAQPPKKVRKPRPAASTLTNDQLWDEIARTERKLARLKQLLSKRLSAESKPRTN